jgi:acetoin utilization deacetylase AcuC-like enzyme
MGFGWVYDRRFLQHDTGPGHIERPARLEVIVDTLDQLGLLGRMEPVPFGAATAAQLALVHDPVYVELVQMMCEGGFTCVGSPDTAVCPKSYDVAVLAAGGVLAACDAVLADRVSRAFCALRPPGHHAERDQALGFCLFNNVAIGAEHLIRHHGLSRVAIVDFDVHHGNGTQHIFEERADVFYISLHERPESLAFPGTGAADEKGRGAGEGYTLNVPLDRGSGEPQYRAALETQVVPALHRYRPEFLLVSAGFDALMWDRISHLSLEPNSFGWITEQLVQVAERYAGGRLVSVLEGGYDLSNLGPAVAAHVASLMGQAV